MSDPVKVAFDTESQATMETLLGQVMQVHSHGISVGHLMELVARACHQVGLEVGLTVAVADVADGRTLRDWIAHVVQQDDPAALRGRDHQAGHFLAALHGRACSVDGCDR